MAVKLRGHAKRHPPPSLPLFPSLFLLRPLSSTPRRLRGFFLSTRLPSPPLLDAGSPRRNWEAKFRGEERSFSGRFCFFFSFEGGEVRIEERKDGVKIVPLYFLARRDLLWRSLDGCKCGWIFFGVCFFDEKEGTGDSFEGIWIRRLGRVMLIARPRVERKRWCRFLIEALPIKTACAEVLFLK